MFACAFVCRTGSTRRTHGAWRTHARHTHSTHTTRTAHAPREAHAAPRVGRQTPRAAHRSAPAARGGPNSVCIAFAAHLLRGRNLHDPGHDRYELDCEAELERQALIAEGITMPPHYLDSSHVGGSVDRPWERDAAEARAREEQEWREREARMMRVDKSPPRRDDERYGPLAQNAQGDENFRKDRAVWYEGLTGESLDGLSLTEQWERADVLARRWRAYGDGRTNKRQRVQPPRAALPAAPPDAPSVPGAPSAPSVPGAPSALHTRVAPITRPVAPPPVMPLSAAAAPPVVTRPPLPEVARPPLRPDASLAGVYEQPDGSAPAGFPYWDARYGEWCDQPPTATTATA
jgi:hypothetical protein